MKNLSTMVKDFSRQHSSNHLPSRWVLNKFRLSLKTNKPVHYVGKAWHVEVLFSFLKQFMEPLDVDRDMKMLLWSGDHFTRILHMEKKRNGPVLDTVLANEVQVVGNFYLRTHLALNRKYCNWGSYRLFHVRPKLHMLFHVLDSCNTGKNPCSDACWMEEDWIRRVAKLARMTHIKTAERSTLQRYVAGHVVFLRSSLPLRCEFLGRTEVCNPGCEAEEVPGLAGLQVVCWASCFCQEKPAA